MKSPLHRFHEKLKAQFIVFHGWRMPLYYKSAIEEALSVREHSGVFDVSHMGRLIVKGKGVKSVLQRLLTNNLERLKPGKVQYSLFTNDKGGIKDDVTVYMLDSDEYLICVNASNREKIFSHLRAFTNPVDISDNTVQIALQGPESERIIKKIFDIDDLKYYRFKTFGNIIVSRTGYTGEKGYEIYAPIKEGTEIFEEILKHSVPCGLASRDILRIEAGYPLYGNEIDEDITPFEAGLERFVDLNKDFLGKEAMLKREIRRKLKSFVVEGNLIPRKGYKIYEGDSEIGIVTSGAFSPVLRKGVGMAFVIKTDIKEDLIMVKELRRESPIRFVGRVMDLIKSRR